jgi:Uma2 family endonuclease
VSHPVPGPFTALDYDRAARAYLQSLPLEHFMEAVPQATQREITVESLALLKTRRPEVQSFNELLVQYFFKGQLRQVVPDNMVIRSDQPAQAVGSYNVELEPVPPFLVLEYVSPTNPRKDYKDSFRKYERELKVPYYLLFYPEKQDLRVYHHTGRRYQRLPPDGQGCIALPELDLHVGLLEGWVRYWHRGRLLKLPGELVDRMAQQAQQIRRQARHIRQLEAHVQDQATELEIKDTQLQQKEEQLSQVRELLRRQVEERARRAGRADLLARLPGTTDLGQLSRWLTELG